MSAVAINDISAVEMEKRRQPLSELHPANASISVMEPADASVISVTDKSSLPHFPQPSFDMPLIDEPAVVDHRMAFGRFDKLSSPASFDYPLPEPLSVTGLPAEDEESDGAFNRTLRSSTADTTLLPVNYLFCWLLICWQTARLKCNNCKVSL